MRNFVLLLALTIVLAACGSRNNRLEKALRLAGDNRPELEKVLNHYSGDAADSLKHKAAVFLIENMPGHCSYVSDRIAGFREEYEKIFLDIRIPLDQKKAQILDLSSLFDLEACLEEDVKIITADYLIDNIDRSFDTWKTAPHCRHLTFDEFCELILPYKVAETQELDEWRERLDKYYNWKNSVIPDDITYSNPQFVAQYITKWLRILNRSNQVPYYGGATLYNKNTLANLRLGICEDYAIATVAIMRSKGVPACVEKVPQWALQSSGHAWYTILNSNGKYLPSPWHQESFPGDVFFPEKKIPKVFRSTYAADPFYEEYQEQSLLKLPSFHKFRKDVTDLYIRTSDLAIPVKTKGMKEKYAYLSMFDNTRWRPIDLGIMKDGKARFNKIGQGIVYIVMGYDGKEFAPISSPFIVEASGEIRYCIPGAEKLDSVKLVRKFPKGPNAAQWENHLIGGEIQGAGKPDFSDAEVLYKITDLEFPDFIPIDTTKKYRLSKPKKLRPTP